MPMYPSPSQIQVIYAEREAQIKVLSKRHSIIAEDVHALTRHGRFQVADELWAKCDQGARTALLNDEHAQVRSAAKLQ